MEVEETIAVAEVEELILSCLPTIREFKPKDAILKWDDINRWVEYGWIAQDLLRKDHHQDYYTYVEVDKWKWKWTICLHCTQIEVGIDEVRSIERKEAEKINVQLMF